jgi:hypothetical protein
MRDEQTTENGSLREKKLAGYNRGTKASDWENALRGG